MIINEFKNLEDKIIEECDINLISKETTKYFTNKVSRVIKKIPHDIYDIKVSMKDYPKVLGYAANYKITSAQEGTMYVTVVVD